MGQYVDDLSLANTEVGSSCRYAYALTPSMFVYYLALCILGTLNKVLWQTMKTQGLHCLLGLKQPSGTEIHHISETATYDPLKYKMGFPIFVY